MIMSRPRTTTRICVESCLQLWVIRLCTGPSTITWSVGNHPLASLDYDRTATSVRIPAQIISFRPCLRSVSAHFIPLCETTQPDNPTIQQWFLCPAADCDRRCAKLYLPPDGTEFRCRRCHNLTYRSAQTHDARLTYLVNHPEELEKAFCSPKLSRQLLALKAALLYLQEQG